MKCRVILLNIVFLIAGRTGAQAPFPGLKSKIDSIVNAGIILNKLPGVAIAIVKDNKIFYTQGYGTKQIRTDKKVDSLTNFHTASISKVFVATAVMKLQEQGKLDIHKKILDYFPGTRITEKRLKNVTIKHMLNHTSGIKDLINYRWYNPRNDST